MEYGNWTDRAITRQTDDRLGFAQYAQVLAGVARSTNDTPLTIGIFGPWGSGKTSLMRLVAEQLQKDYKEPIIVEFNAWHYDKEDALWRALIISVLAELREQVRTMPQDEAQAFTPTLDELETRLYRTVEREEVGGITIDWGNALKGTVAGAMHLSLAMIPGVGAALSKLAEKAEEQITGEDVKSIFDAVQRERRKIYREHIRSMEQFRRDFANLVRKSVVEKDRRLVVFIDDLDRCLPEKAIEVLEALKLFLDVKGCIFFLGADRKVIQRGIQVKYRGFLSAAKDQDAADRRIPIEGDDYLEKIVQLPFHLLPLDESRIEQFVRASHPDLETNCADIFAAGLQANPRKVKRALNMFRLLTSLAEIRRDELKVNEQPVAIDPHLLAKLVVIQSRYRDLYARLEESPAFLVHLERHYSGDIDPTGESAPLDPRYTEWLQAYQNHPLLPRLLGMEPPFSSLSLDELKVYLYLTATVEAGDPTQAAADAISRLWQALLSYDSEKIRQAAAVIQQEEPDVLETFRRRLAAAIEQRDGLAYTPQQLHSIGTALALLGDPRDLDAMASVWAGVYAVGEQAEKQQVEGFKIGKYPVTNQQYQRFLAAKVDRPVPPYWDAEKRTYPTELANHPVVSVSWEDAQAYCEWIGKRLPTAVEWEVAARAKGEIVANTDNELQGTSSVGAFSDDKGLCGVLDMVGNVSEWTLTPGADAAGEQTYLVKGGNWQTESKPVWYAAELAKSEKKSTVGFRVAE